MYCNKSIFDFSEKPNDEEWLSLNRMKIPLLLNYAQCKLLNKEYYSVIEHCTTVLKTESGIQIYYGIVIRLHRNISKMLSSFFYSQIMLRRFIEEVKHILVYGTKKMPSEI